ncbi:MAG: L,D-transpeptidase [Thermomicrobiales bacterium]
MVRYFGRAGNSVSSSGDWMLAVLVVALVTIAVPAPALGASNVASSTGPAYSDRSVAADLGIPSEMIPPDLGESSLQVYVEESGHTVGGWMLDYWRANGAGEVYGNPISEPFDAGGYYSQAFERGVFQFYPELLWTELPVVGLMPIGHTALNGRVGAFRADGRRAGGGGDRRVEAWLPTPLTGSEFYDEVTGHTISGSFLEWYEDHEGEFYLGSPISEPVAERGQDVQYFERGVLLDGKRGTRLAPLAAELTASDHLLVDTEPIRQGDLPLYDETEIVSAPNPAPVDGGEATGRKRIEVDISEQTIRAYQGGSLVMEALVSTGIKPNGTEKGEFHVRIKRELEDMAGFTDSTGEVVALGDEPTEDSFVGNQESYDVEDVPNVLYFNQEAEALHGAYWHDNFGTPMSHGCVNLPLDVAAFLFEWAPLGTEVWVHE